MTRPTFTLGVDFDGTIVEHQYPAIGKLVPGAIETLQFLASHGVRLILWTVRDGDELAQAIAFLSANGVHLYGVNANPDSRSTSPKVWCDAYVDDCAIGCPLVPATTTRNPMVDWSVVRATITAMLLGPARRDSAVTNRRPRR